jgi:hypothetical protein
LHPQVTTLALPIRGRLPLFRFLQELMKMLNRIPMICVGHEPCVLLSLGHFVDSVEWETSFYIINVRMVEVFRSDDVIRYLADGLIVASLSVGAGTIHVVLNSLVQLRLGLHSEADGYVDITNGVFVTSHLAVVQDHFFDQESKLAVRVCFRNTCHKAIEQFISLADRNAFSLCFDRG